MASQPHIQGRRGTQGEEKKKIQANTHEITKIHQYSLDQGLVKKRGSQIGQFVTTFSTIWSSKKGPLHKLPHSNIKAVMVLTHGHPYSMYRFLQFIFDDGTPTTDPRKNLYW